MRKGIEKGYKNLLSTQIHIVLDIFVSEENGLFSEY